MRTKSILGFVFGLVIGLVGSASALGGGWGYVSCLTSGSSTPCPVGATCNYFYTTCTTGDPLDEENGGAMGAYHSCGSWGLGCGVVAKCQGYATGGFACQCGIPDTCP
jgi:hypothetical protein